MSSKEMDSTLQSGMAEYEVALPLSQIQVFDTGRRQLLLQAVPVGLAAGWLAVLFYTLLSNAERLRTSMIVWAQQYPAWGWLLPVLWGVVGATLSVALVMRYAPEASGSGIPHLRGVLQHVSGFHWRVLPVKFIGGVLAIGGGMALGREGPSVQIGSIAGDALARLFKLSLKDRLILVTAGAGAGLSAAFNAPLSGVVFVLEELRRDFHPTVFGAALIASLTGNFVTGAMLGTHSVFKVPAYDVPPLGTLPLFALLGVLAGLLGVVFNRSLIGSLNGFARFELRPRMYLVAGLGAAIGLVGWFLPGSVGMGHGLTERVLAGEQMPLLAILGWFALRFVLTQTSYGTGAPGGIFAPLLVLGSLLGLAVGCIARTFSPENAMFAGAFAVVGMAAYFAGIVHAPLTGVILIVEMTRSYNLMLPLLFSSLFAYVTVEMLRDVPIYEALLERDLERNGIHSLHRAPISVMLEIKPGSPFDGREIKALGLPPGCLLTRCTDGRREWIPQANTVLHAHMRITAAFAPNDETALNALRRGCAAAGNPAAAVGRGPL